ncbi:MAG: Holliday junction resolvase RuvX [bacterium]
MRIIGLDYGDKRIGVAVSDLLEIIASGVTAVANLAELKKVIDNYTDVKEIVVGLPKKLDGSLGIQAEKTNAFIEELKKIVNYKIVTWDERLTTSQAERGMIAAGLSRAKRKKVIDQSAAAIILQSYLDCRKK